MKYRCCKCNKPKNDHGRFVRYKRLLCKLCQRCANELKEVSNVNAR